MTKTRLNIPTSSLPNMDVMNDENRTTIAEIYRAVCLKFLKIYQQHKKADWESTTGRATNAVKSGFSAVRGLFGGNSDDAAKHDPTSITISNDNIIKEINSLNSYESYISLIDRLKDSAIAAFKASNTKSSRTDFYFAIIGLVQESIKLQFPQRHDAEIAKHRQLLAQAHATYDSRFDSKNDIQKDWQNINNVLTQLVLLGDESVYKEAFTPGRKLFYYLTDMNDAIVNEDEAKLAKQFGREENRKVGRVFFVNPNIPLQLQRYYPRLLLMSNELGPLKTDNMVDLVNLAKGDHPMLNTTTPFRNRFLPDLDPPAPNQQNELEDLQDAETPPKANMGTPPQRRASIPQSPQPQQFEADGQEDLQEEADTIADNAIANHEEGEGRRLSFNN